MLRLDPGREGRFLNKGGQRLDVGGVLDGGAHGSTPGRLCRHRSTDRQALCNAAPEFLAGTPRVDQFDLLLPVDARHAGMAPARHLKAVQAEASPPATARDDKEVPAAVTALKAIPDRLFVCLRGRPFSLAVRV